jgi:hypothetical protein
MRWIAAAHADEKSFGGNIVAGAKTPKERVEQLLAETKAFPMAYDSAHQTAWLVAAQHIVQIVCPLHDDLYRQQATLYANRGTTLTDKQPFISGMIALLERLLEDMESGFLTSLENHAIAATFDDFLDHGAEYLKHGRKDEAGVIAGIVFEDTVRRICRVRNIVERGIALDTLITELLKQGVLTALKAKRARAAAGLRTSAAHARWEEFEAGDVRPVIELTRELIDTQLG